jgi:hypothetical protein
MGFEFAYCLGGGEMRPVKVSAGCAVSARGIYQLSSDGKITSAATNDAALIVTLASAASGGTTLCVRNPDAVFMSKSYYTSTCQTGDMLDYVSAQGLTSLTNGDVQIVKTDSAEEALYVRISPGNHAFD